MGGCPQASIPSQLVVSNGCKMPSLPSKELLKVQHIQQIKLLIICFC